MMQKRKVYLYAPELLVFPKAILSDSYFFIKNKALTFHF